MKERLFEFWYRAHYIRYVEYYHHEMELKGLISLMFYPLHIQRSRNSFQINKNVNVDTKTEKQGTCRWKTQIGHTSCKWVFLNNLSFLSP